MWYCTSNIRRIITIHPEKYYEPTITSPKKTALQLLRMATDGPRSSVSLALPQHHIWMVQHPHWRDFPRERCRNSERYAFKGATPFQSLARTMNAERHNRKWMKSSHAAWSEYKLDCLTIGFGPHIQWNFNVWMFGDLGGQRWGNERTWPSHMICSSQ